MLTQACGCENLLRSYNLNFTVYIRPSIPLLLLHHNITTRVIMLRGVEPSVCGYVWRGWVRTTGSVIHRAQGQRYLPPPDTATTQRRILKIQEHCNRTLAVSISFGLVLVCPKLYFHNMKTKTQLYRLVLGKRLNKAAPSCYIGRFIAVMSAFVDSGHANTWIYLRCTHKVATPLGTLHRLAALEYDPILVLD